MDRRLFLASATGSAAALSLTAFSASAAQAATSAKLPYEVSRVANVTTPSGHKLYDNIEVNINGDRARIFLPQAVKLKSSTAVGAVWFYHGADSSHNAMNGGFKYPAELVVDQGAIAICINAGGTEYTAPVATQAQVNAWKYLSALFNVRMNFLRATSAGGALGCYTYGKKLIPYIRGLYMVNGLYDMEWLYNADPGAHADIARAYGGNEATIVASNPARIPASSWTGANVKVMVSDAAHPDRIIDPGANGLALVKKITSVAGDTRVEYHTLGHTTPSSSNKDMIKVFGEWSGLF